MRNTGKDLNQLGLGRLNGGQDRFNGDNLSNGNNLGIASDYRTASNPHGGPGVYGQQHGANLHANAASNVGVRDREDGA